MDYAAMGEKIRALRKTQGITQGELARLSGISQAFLGNIERGGRIASLETLVKICNALKTDANFLLAQELQYLPEKSLPDLLRQALELAVQAGQHAYVIGTVSEGEEGHRGVVVEGIGEA